MFLLVAIGATVSYRILNPSLTASLGFVDSEEVDYQAEVYTKESVSREDRIANLRDKIANGESLAIASPEIPIPETVDETSPTEVSTTTAVATVATLKQCANYSSYAGLWSASGIKFTVAEGSRLIYRDKISTDATAIPQREVLLQLPVYAVPSANSEVCLPSDVIGIAQDGSLIRNDETGLYSVFGEATLVGYALDGFPIYGKTSAVTDACGGKVEAGQYRYYLSSERETVINCFAATPVKL